MQERKMASFTTFNPYEGRFPERRVISREALLLAKRLRLEGFEVDVGGSGPSKVDYVSRKGFGQLLSDPVIVFIAGVAASVAVNLASSWLYDLLRRTKPQAPVISDGLDLVIEVDESGKRLRYDHKGREISDARFESILSRMNDRQNAYTRTLQIPSPNSTLPVPIYLEHSDKIIGWASVGLDDNGLVVRQAQIHDDATWERVQAGELKGFSIAGLVAECKCEKCGKDFRDCSHGAYHGETDVLNHITQFDICEISVVSEPIGYGTEIRRGPNVD